MRSIALLPPLIAALSLTAATNVHPNFTDACEIVRAEWILADPTLEFEPRLRCGATYSASTEPVLQINVTLPVCIARWNGWQISQVSQLSQWIGPLVGFLLPALVFVLCIPRNYRMPRGEDFFDLNIFVSGLWLIAAFILMVVDTIVWIILVFGLAGLLMVGAVDEGLKDWRILRKVEKESERAMKSGKISSFSRRQASYAVLLTLVGTFVPRENPNLPQPEDLYEKVINDVCDTPDIEEAKSKLNDLVGHHSSYGMAIGAPVIFYLGAYGYALVDANSRLGDNDTAHAVAFGLWYGIIVLTATSCCCVLGITKPATLESVFGRPRLQLQQARNMFDPFDSPYRTVWLWNRGQCVRSWSDKSIVGRGNPVHESIKHILKSRTTRFFACVISCGVIAIVCTLAILVSYYTPLLGFGCRATSVLVYGVCQNFLIICWFYHNESEKNKYVKYIVYGFAALCFGTALFASIGGTIMQLLGVYRNCICKAGIRYWLDKENGIVDLATDTEFHRNYASLWIKIGIAGVAYIGSISVLGWGYYMKMKSKCKKIIEGLRDST